MKKFFLVFIALLVLGCVKPFQVSNTTEAPDKLWEEISVDLAYLYTLVESYNKNIERERSLVKVRVEPWVYPKGKTISIKKPSEGINYSVIKETFAKVPTKTGVVDAKITKAIGPSGISWFAVDKKYIQAPMAQMVLSRCHRTPMYRLQSVLSQGIKLVKMQTGGFMKPLRLAGIPMYIHQGGNLGSFERSQPLSFHCPVGRFSTGSFLLDIT